jgi:VCBS repeat-containing protein
VNVTVTSTDAGGLSTNQLFAITVTNVNETPTAISLDSSTVAENAVGAVMGNLTTTDPDAGDTHTYTVDDARFEVVAGQLKLKAGQSLDFETEPSVNVTVTSTDAGGLNTNQLFSITVTNVNETPTAISLDNSTVAENAAGAVIGNLTTTDPDAGDTHTYTVDDARFEVVAGQLKLKAGQSLDFETEPSVNVTVTSTDAGGLNTNQLFSIKTQWAPSSAISPPQTRMLATPTATRWTMRALRSWLDC